MFFGPGNFTFFVLLALALFGCLIYLGVGLRVLREESVEKPNRIAEFYAYSVCLVAIITFLISFSSLVGAFFDLGNPLYSGRDGYGFPRQSLASFETYKMDVLNPPYGGQNSQSSRYVPDDQTFRATYEAAKADRIATVKHAARRSLTVDSLLIVASIVLFAIHWKWMKKLKRAD